MKAVKRILSTMFVLLIFVFLMSGCDSAPLETGDPSVVEGYVTDRDGNAGFSKPAEGIEGATVTLARLKSNGEYQTVSESEVNTDAEGYFTVETDIDGESHLVAIAEKGATIWRGIISNEVKNGTTVKAAPLTKETTVEVDVLAKVLVQSNDEYTKAHAAVETQNAINADVAVESYLFQSAYAELAGSIINRMQGKWESAQAEPDTSKVATFAELEASIAAQVEAQVTLEQALFNANGNTSEINSAYSEYNQAWMDAYTDAGVYAEVYAKSEQIASWIAIQSSTGLQGAAEFAYAKKAAYHKAMAFAHALEVSFHALINADAATTANVDAVSSTGETLVANVKSATSIDDISAAFSTYHEAVITELATAIGDNTNETSEDVLSVNTTINSTAKTTLTNAIRTAVGVNSIDINAIISAYVSFYDDVENIVGDAQGDLSQLFLGQKDSVVSAMILANIVVD